jgi:hypothetical protein
MAEVNCDYNFHLDPNIIAEVSCIFPFLPQYTNSSNQFAEEMQDINMGALFPQQWIAPNLVPVPNVQFEPRVAAQCDKPELKPIANIAAAQVATHATAKKPASRKSTAKRPRSTTVTDDIEPANMKKPHKKKNEEKENKVEVDEDDEILAKGRIWSYDDKTTFFEWLLGADSTVFDTHKTNPD